MYKKRLPRHLCNLHFGGAQRWVGAHKAVEFMEQRGNHGREYAVDEHCNAGGRSEGSHGSFIDEELNETDYEDDLEPSIPSTDTSALEARNGKDIQGIPWERFNFTRETYRRSRLKQYKNYESLSFSSDDLEKLKCKEVEKGHNFYDFHFNTRAVKSTIVHFQLRNLLWATSKHDVYLMQNYSVMHWSALLRRPKEVLNVSRPIQLTEKYPQHIAQSISQVYISTMAVKENLMVAGGFHGELICKRLNHCDIAFCTKLSPEENAITNSVDIFCSPSGSTQLSAANNDSKVRIFDMSAISCLSSFTFPWPVNNASANPDGKLIAVLGDSPDCLLADMQSGKVVNSLKGHLDYSFASAWHPEGLVLATGNQDRTCQLWDLRRPSESLAVLEGRMGAIRALRFTSDGRFLAMAEPADFVHVFDARSGYATGQEIDLFGEIAGISFSPDAGTLFVSVSDRTYGSLMEFRRRYCHCYLDCIF
ncbi:uncharacterized WD repeat-containing protein C2A9.03-like isoform X3 [Andrographis paniculata]|uniref:uncharacterized WD repeat-containing protein C2A9.03-like isoform X3 n=1 Tax=Andrographis paniculata TaxID=175694 RepID=UPI0021E765DA|nr:uncharacterized WD repeat-containing protein C2A9.03-like isoform X3 [Andrographis paniculata]